MRGKLLLVSESPSEVQVRELLQDTSYELLHQHLRERLAEPSQDVTAVLAEAVPSAAGTALIGSLKQRRWKTPVVALIRELRAGAGAQTAAVEWADDFLIVPWQREELLLRVSRLAKARAESKDSKQVLMREFTESQLVGEAPCFQAAIDQARQIACCGATALIRGETGTGKELYARAIHHLGTRRDYPFLPVDCASLPDQLFENELFGHERGAYTDARNSQPGLISLAEGGTLFLDEVDALSPGSQAKLLRFLQEKTYRQLGASTWRTANVNVLAASNRNLEAGVEARQFRQDLYFRLNVLTLHLPPLRDRISDIPLLARHFLAACGRAKTFSPAALCALSLYSWPGNVRELQSAVLRAVLRSRGTEILPEDLDLPGSSTAAAILNYREMRKQVIENFERQYLEALLQEVNGNITQAAKRAGKERRAMGRLVKKHTLHAG
jgi:two-component system, NtrC family, response regulator GlrR